MKKAFLALALAGAVVSSTADAEIIELADGRFMQGEVVSGQTNDDGLAVRVFETGGVVVVRWDHVLAERAKELRIQYGIDLPENEGLPVTGHTVRLTNGAQVTGVCENLAEYASGSTNKLRVKTPTGVQVYEREQVGKVTPVEIEALEAYTKEELYAGRMAESPPDSAAAHFAMGDYCEKIGDYEHAKEHYEAARADADFAATNDGKSLDARIRRSDVLIRGKGAQELAQAIQRAMFGSRYNEALDKLKELDESYDDPQIREAIGFERLANKVVRERDEHFKKRVAVRLYDIMDDLIRKKVSERKSLRPGDEEGSTAGTLNGARQWAARVLPVELKDAVANDLGLESDEAEAFWNERTVKKVRTGNYGTGSFIVLKRATLSGDQRRRRPPPGAKRRDGGGGGGGGGGGAGTQPKTDEQWWDAVRTSDRANWLEAYFAENSGIFEIIRTDESDLCPNCAGKGILSTSSGEGEETQTYCPQCNGSGKFKKVYYR